MNLRALRERAGLIIRNVAILVNSSIAVACMERDPNFYPKNWYLREAVSKIELEASNPASGLFRRTASSRDVFPEMPISEQTVFLYTPAPETYSKVVDSIKTELTKRLLQIVASQGTLEQKRRVGFQLPET